MTDRRQQFSDYLDGQLSPEQFVDLCAWISEDSENAAAIAELSLLETHLRDKLRYAQVEADEASGDALPKIEVEPASLSRRTKRYDSIHWQRHKIRFNAMTAVLTALAWIGFSYFVWSSTTPDGFQPNRGDNFQYVAEITGQYESRWAEGMPPMSHRTALLAGERLDLAEGLVEITFDDGAKVVLEGPTEFVVDSLGAGTLEEGKLAVTVPQRAVGFSVHTPLFDVVDLGTKFGVEIDAQGNGDVVVSKGEVLLKIEGGTPRQYTLVADQQATITRGANLVAVEVHEVRVPVGRFVHSLLTKPQMTASADPAPLVITSLTVTNTSYASAYSIQTNLVEGVRSYGDRHVVYANIAANAPYLLGANYIRTANRDQANTKVNVNLTIDTPSVVYVSIDDRHLAAGGMPDFFATYGFTDTGDDILNVDAALLTPVDALADANRSGIWGAGGNVGATILPASVPNGTIFPGDDVDLGETPSGFGWYVQNETAPLSLYYDLGSAVEVDKIHGDVPLNVETVMGSW